MPASIQGVRVAAITEAVGPPPEGVEVNAVMAAVAPSEGPEPEAQILAKSTDFCTFCQHLVENTSEK